jgi:hypothetical protein
MVTRFAGLLICDCTLQITASQRLGLVATGFAPLLGNIFSIGRSSASWLVSSQADGHFTPISYLSAILSQSYVMTNGQSGLMPGTHLAPMTKCLSCADSCMFIDMEAPALMRGRVRNSQLLLYHPSAFTGPSPSGLTAVIYSLKFENPLTWRARSLYLYPQEQGGPVIAPGTGFHPLLAQFATLLMLSQSQRHVVTDSLRVLVSSSVTA